MNQPPYANDEYYIVSEDSLDNQLQVLINDTDPDGHPLQIISVTQPTHGNIVYTPTYVEYTPSLNYNGTDSFMYTISDGHGGTDTATVHITITAFNDTPNKPDRPSGSTEGKINVEYTYTTKTIVVEGDLVWYWFDWGDGTNSGCVGPYPSNALASASHTWTTKGTYNIKVKAIDPSKNESDWSNPLAITMPLDVESANTMLLDQIKQSQKNFIFLKQIII